MDYLTGGTLTGFYNMDLEAITLFNDVAFKHAVYSNMHKEPIEIRGLTALLKTISSILQLE